MNQIPEPWDAAIIQAGFTDPRYKDARPSMGALATAAGLHTTTVSRMVHGKGSPDPANVAAVAGALRVDVVVVSRWVDQARSQTEPYTPPPEADLLSRRQQEAVTELIRSIAARDEKAGGEHVDSSASNTRAAGSAATYPIGRESSGEHADPPPEEGASPPPRRGSDRQDRDG